MGLTGAGLSKGKCGTFSVCAPRPAGVAGGFTMRFRELGREERELGRLGAAKGAGSGIEGRRGWNGLSSSSTAEWCSILTEMRAPLIYTSEATQCIASKTRG